MKKFFITLLCFVCMCSYGQLQGSFNYGQDGHIYFSLYNTTGYQVPVAWGVSNFSKNESRQNTGVMAPFATFVYGPNANWVWEKGEVFIVTYSNGQSVHWTCPQSDPALRSQINPSFKGKHCSGTVGCSCPGFSPITNAEIWKREYCRHCGHKKGVHK